jgi:hypothetical protein
MPKRHLYSDKDTGTFADALKAVGLAEVLRAWLRHLDFSAEPIVIEDKGAYYRIEIPCELDGAVVERVRHPFNAGRGQLLMGKRQEARATTRRDARTGRCLFRTA